ncbi:Ppx/GppA phosphatase family protein [Stygiolobus caldivivus]|uniref:Exopolyphosphatase n=1 Tax=Stygiolobus caldivivus TaxID=2824673 RepID=A0A8D5ZGS5_9CREN|nr:Ppx/GppA phosphatase family protein [Stygiolobus caldivivus]BCU69089.1 exopolyphosphatase [Stygiolobus caldivivus]
MNYKAVIDAGYNSFRLSLYTVFPNNSFRLTASLKDYVRLGLGVSEGKPIPEENVKRAEITLRKFREFLDKKGIKEVKVLGTSAFRYAQNGPEVSERLSKTIDIPITVLSGEEEGRYSALAVINTLPIDEGVVFDIGGGSLEIAYFSQRKIREIYQFPLGGLRLMDKSPEEIRKEVRIALASLPSSKGVLVGSGGNLRAIAKMDLKLEGVKLNQIHGYTVSYERISKYSKILPSMSISERSQLPGIDTERALTIHSAAIVIKELMEILGKDSIITSAFGLREGVLMESEIDTVEKLREFWLEGLSYQFNVEPLTSSFENVLAETNDIIVATAFYFLQIMKASNFIDPYMACYKVLRELTLPGYRADEINLVTTICAIAKKFKKKYYNKVKKLIDKDTLLIKAKKVKEITDSYELGVRKW